MDENYLRAAAAIGALLIIAGPTIWHYADALRQRLAAGVSGGEVRIAPDADLHLVLSLASRLRAAGSAEGVTLCQQLIDVMLGVPEQKK